MVYTFLEMVVQCFISTGNGGGGNTDGEELHERRRYIVHNIFLYQVS